MCSHFLTFSRGNTMKEITFSSLKSSLTNKYQNSNSCSQILCWKIALLKKKKKEHYWISQVDMKFKMLRFCSRVFLFFLFYHSLTPMLLPFLLATWLNMIQKSEFIHYNYLGRQTLSVLIWRAVSVNTDLPKRRKSRGHRLWDADCWMEPMWADGRCCE